MYYFVYNILEQFDLFTFSYLDMLSFAGLVVLYFVLLSMVLFFDYSLGNVIMLTFMACMGFYFNTANFLSCVIFVIGMYYYFECTSLYLSVGYLYVFVASDFFMGQMQLHLGGRLNTYYFFLWSTAVVLGLCNLFGIMPFSKALTAHFIFAFYFSLSHFVVQTIYGLFVHSVKIFNLFLTKEMPLFIIPVLICMEAISFLSSIFSLAISLFANLVAGHILLKILIIFLAKILEIHLSFSFPSIIMFFGILIIITLEVMISILQVYIFNMLLLMYVKNVLKLH